jgi:hypothetical protein
MDAVCYLVLNANAQWHSSAASYNFNPTLKVILTDEQLKNIPSSKFEGCLELIAA